MTSTLNWAEQQTMILQGFCHRSCRLDGTYAVQETDCTQPPFKCEVNFHMLYDAKSFLSASR